MCTFCVVPLPADITGNEPQSIMTEIQDLWDKGFKEITLDKTWIVSFGMAAD
jgi:tRNA-2-methylthio-N6-dimethylallyladenosine synthase